MKFISLLMVTEYVFIKKFNKGFCSDFSSLKFSMVHMSATVRDAGEIPKLKMLLGNNVTMMLAV